MTSPDTIIAGGAALISSIAALVAIWNAKSASKQADLAEEQADAAKIQAEEAKRSADAAWGQLDHSKHQYRASMIDRQREAFESVLKGAREYERFITSCGKVDSYREVEDIHNFLEEMPSSIPDFKILQGTLPGHSELRFASMVMSRDAVKYMANTLIVLSTSPDEPDSVREKYQGHLDENRRRFLDAMNRFEKLGEEYFARELRNLVRHWHTEVSAPNQ